ncbi:MAG TPA: TadE family protein [Planctomycetaceae bacterium]|jgi:Flp pilus assembly protein TadG
MRNIVHRQNKPRPRLGGPRVRFGAAAVELALCTPLLIVLAFGMIESCNVVYLRTRMYTAAYEAARLATRPVTAATAAATASQVSTYGSTLLTQLGVQSGTVSISPGNLSSVVPQQQVTVTISAPLNKNTTTALVVNSAQTISAQVTLIVE